MILDIVTYPAASLKEKCVPVTEITDEIRQLAADMLETMYEAPGVGLAAPQVGVGLQLFVWSYRGGGPFDRRYRDALALDLAPTLGFNDAMSGVVINPTLDLVWDEAGAGAILPAQPDIADEVEGCLSVPGVTYPLRRALGAILRGYDANGRPITVAARGWLARIFQHEYDHLRGTLYVDRLEEPYGQMAAELAHSKGWGCPGYTWTPGERT